jgi:type IV pilus assembly protein PilQ
MKYNKTKKLQSYLTYNRFILPLFLLAMYVPYILANNSTISDLISTSNLNIWVDDNAITDLNFSVLPGNIIKIELSLIKPVDIPTRFQMDNPARIVLDFVRIHSNLIKKRFSINQGAVESIYIAEASKKTRVIIDLKKSVLYEIKRVGKKIYILVNSGDINKPTGAN